MKAIAGWFRVLIGFLACALAIPVELYFLGFFGPFVGLMAVLTMTLTAVLGLPIFSIFYAKKWFKLWQSMLSGAFIAGCFWLILALGGKVYANFGWAFYIAIIGAWHGLLFWLIAIWRNQILFKAS